MNELIRAIFSARWLSGGTVFLVAWIIGSKAAEGMNLFQWAGALVALAGAIAWAVIEQVWPARRRQTAED
ncbi:MAG: hypothetical protein EON95_06480 [Caulobacteraceae bacterium]|nr:hypothetical protein [Caulobacter sp.]RYF94117.1 MAG: hypothetical protein EON95_06480 [Caulobacteraceae bacterium]